MTHVGDIGDHPESSYSSVPGPGQEEYIKAASLTPIEIFVDKIESLAGENWHWTTGNILASRLREALKEFHKS